MPFAQWGPVYVAFPALFPGILPSLGSFASRVYTFKLTAQTHDMFSNIRKLPSCLPRVGARPGVLEVDSR